MGFFDSFVSGVGSFLGSPLGTALGQIGIAKLVDITGLTPTGPSGSPRSGIAPFSPLGTPVTSVPFKTAQQLADEALRRAEEQAFLFGRARCRVAIRETSRRRKRTNRKSPLGRATVHSFACLGHDLIARHRHVVGHHRLKPRRGAADLAALPLDRIEHPLNRLF